MSAEDDLQQAGIDPNEATERLVQLARDVTRYVRAHVDSLPPEAGQLLGEIGLAWAFALHVGRGLPTMDPEAPSVPFVDRLHERCRDLTPWEMAAHHAAQHIEIERRERREL